MSHKKAVVFILLGQSNAVGHDLPMREEDKISSPLKNVFGLSRENNQSFESTELVWSGYTSFGMNLAEQQDDTYSIANCLACVWQKSIDDGNPYGLPNLYIVQIAIGAQGVTEQYMWYPKREPKLIPGKLGTVDISLFPFTNHVFSLLDRSFSQMGKDYEIMGLHWRGGENDIIFSAEYLSEHLEPIYHTIFDEFNRLLKNPPIILHKIVCEDCMNETDASGNYLKNMYYVNDVFDRLCQRYKNASVFDPRTAPQYVPDVRGNGLFMDDAVHYTPEVNTWIAKEILKTYVKG